MYGSNPAVRAIMEKAVLPVLSSRHHGGIGRIISYDGGARAADVEMTLGGERRILFGVPVLVPPGLSLRDPRPGDEVWVAFAGGSDASPFVLWYAHSGKLSVRCRSRFPYWG